MAFGVLALQGDFAAHAALLGSLGQPATLVRRTADLRGLRGLGEAMRGLAAASVPAADRLQVRGW